MLNIELYNLAINSVLSKSRNNEELNERIKNLLISINCDMVYEKDIDPVDFLKYYFGKLFWTEIERSLVSNNINQVNKSLKEWFNYISLFTNKKYCPDGIIKSFKERNRPLYGNRASRHSAIDVDTIMMNGRILSSDKNKDIADSIRRIDNIIFGTGSNYSKEGKDFIDYWLDDGKKDK